MFRKKILNVSWFQHIKCENEECNISSAGLLLVREHFSDVLLILLHPQPLTDLDDKVSRWVSCHTGKVTGQLFEGRPYIFIDHPA